MVSEMLFVSILFFVDGCLNSYYFMDNLMVISITDIYIILDSYADTDYNAQNRNNFILIYNAISFFTQSEFNF